MARVRPENAAERRREVWLRLFAADQLRWSWVTMVLGIAGMALCSLAGRPETALLWLATIFVAKGLQLLMCRRIVTVDQRVTTQGWPLASPLAVAGTVLGLAWLLLPIVVSNSGRALELGALAVLLVTAASLSVSILRCCLSLPGELQRLATAQEQMASPAVLARATRCALRKRARKRRVTIHVAKEPGVPLLVGERAALQRLWTVLAACGLGGCPVGGHVRMTAGVNGLGGVRLTVATNGNGIGGRGSLAVAEGLARRHQAAMSIGLAAEGLVLTIDFPAWRTVDMTPVERRPLVPPTTGQQLLMAVTR